MALFHESTIDVPDRIRDTETVGIGLSSWVHRLDAVAKCYNSKESEARAREIAVYERLGTERREGVMRCYGVLDGQSVVLQFARHGSIRQYQHSHYHDTPLPVKLRWAQQATKAMAFLHSRRVLHCDISCNNIFLDENLDAMVGDFAGSSLDGKQCLSWYDTSHAHPDTTTPSVKSEIFALGSTFYELLLGEKPFQGMNERAIEESFRQHCFPSLEPLPALRSVIAKCWEQQYDTVADLLCDIDLEGVLKPSPLRAFLANNT